jgi:hypothetical protein
MAQQFADLDEQTQTDLVAWLNHEPDDEDRARLLALYLDRGFKAWDCPSCGDRVYEAQPDSWDHFQGAQQIDRVSYPGKSIDDKRCDFCRCHNR